MTDFLLKSTLCLGLLYAVYFFLLEKEKMHHFNRFFLLFSLVFSLIIPFISFEIYVESVETITHGIVQAMPISSVPIEEKTDYLFIILWCIYGVVTTILLIRFVANLIKIQRKINSNTTDRIQNSTLVLLNEKVLPHTFLNSIFINKNDYENRKIEAELYTHELTHVSQKHTLDILFIEILKTIFWFNPILILYKKAIQLNHEFLADEKVVKSYNNVPFYQNLLLEKASWNKTFYLASNLNFLVTKKRLIMMTKTASAKIILLKKIALLPLLTGLIYFLCVETVAQQKSKSPNTQTQQTKSSNDKKRDTFFAGVRIKIYKNGYKTKTGVVGEGVVMDKLYEDLTPEEKERCKMWLYVPNIIVKKSPTKKEFEAYKNNKKYAIWIDDKNVPNSELDKYKPEDIAHFSGSVILKNARTKKHPQPFQFWFFTHPYFDKNGMGKEQKKYGGEQIEIFENFDKKRSFNTLAVVNQNIVEEVQGTNSDIHNTVEKQPSFQGGLDKFYTYFGENYKVPNIKDLEGQLMMQFVVEKDGSLSEIKVLKDIGHGSGDEAVRVLKNSPKWNPGEQDGKPVRVLYSLPISIKAK